VTSKVRILSTVIFATLVFSFALGQKPGQPKTNRPPKIRSFISDVNMWGWCHWTQSACSASDGVIKLTVDASDPDGDSLDFKCTTSAGKLSICGKSMSWDLRNQANSTYTATVTVNDGRGGEDTAEVKVTIAECSSCDGPPPPCPNISISTPNGTDDIKHLVFKVSTDRASSYPTGSYRWTASHGKIIKGEHASEVVIDATGFDGEELTVKVEVGGFDPSCSTVQSQRLLIKQN
jgi:hypothetical protein